MAEFTCSCGNGIYPIEPINVRGMVLSETSADACFLAIANMIDDYLAHSENNSVDKWRTKHFKDAYLGNVSPGCLIRELIIEQTRELTLPVYECDECGRLWIRESPFYSQYKGYSPDDAPNQRAKILGFNKQDNPHSYYS